jgi:hypothetical protein
VTSIARVVLPALLLLALVAGVATAGLTGGEPLTGRPAPLRAAPELPAEGAGTAEVLLSADARTHPTAALVRDQLQAHYDAINARDWDAWAATVAPERSEALPEEDFRAAYASTRDGTIRIDRIDDLPGRRVLVRVRFVSTQDLDAAPDAARAERICWRSSLPMSGEPPRIEATGGGSSLPTPC